MDLDTLLDVGSFCENLLQNPHFQFLSATFESNSIHEMLATKAHEAKAREFIYSKVTAHREFLSLLGDIIKQKREALEKQNPDQLDQIDNPAVHDIFRIED